MTPEKKYTSIVKHYQDCFKTYGDSHKGMDWPKLDDVYKRYNVMLDLIRLKESSSNKVSLLDFGCGTAMLNEYIKSEHIDNIIYSGLDISEGPVNIARSKFPENDFYCLDILEEPGTLPDFDYVIMNGVFTEKINLTTEEMIEYFQKMMLAVFKKTNKGVAFNVMSKAVDWERDDLFHLSTDLLINFATKNLSRNFIIRNDYGLYEYTVYIYK